MKTGLVVLTLLVLALTATAKIQPEMTANVTVEKVSSPGQPTSRTMTVTMKDISTRPLTFFGISIEGDTNFTQTNDCPTQLQAGKSCKVHVTFQPSSAGQHVANLVIRSNADNTIVNVPLSGVGD